MAEQETKTFLEAPGTDFYQMLADKLIAEMPPDQRVRAIEALLLTAAKAHQDEAALQSVDLLAKAYEQEEMAIAGGKGDRRRANERYYAHLLELYWRLPDARKEHEHRIEGKWEWVPRGTLVKTKLRILRVVIGGWYAGPTESSVRAFRFLIAAYQPRQASTVWRLDPASMPVDYRVDFRYEGESDDEMRARGRFVSKEEQKRILELIREHTASEFYWPAEDLEPWLVRPRMPDEIQKILVLARARNGGRKLAERDIRNARILAAIIALEQRTKRECLPATTKWITEQTQSIAILDGRVKQLLDAIQPKLGIFGNVNQIGESDYVLGELCVEFKLGDSHWIVQLTVQLPPDCPEPLGRDVLGRARHHIEKWRETFYDVSVDLAVKGGVANLILTHSFLFHPR